MKNSIKIEFLNICKQRIKENFLNILSEFHISTLSNMLAIHYSLIEKPENILDFLSLSINRVKKFTNEKIFFDDEFSTSLALFAVAIKDDANSSKDTKSLENQISKVIVNSIYQDLEPREKNLALELISEILSSNDVSNCINFIYANQGVIINSIKSSNNFNLKSSYSSIQKQSEIFNQSRNNSQINSDLSNIIATIIVTSALIAGSALLGALAPILIIPATFIGVNAGSRINKLINIGSSNPSYKMTITNKNFGEPKSEKNVVTKQNSINIDQNDLDIILKGGLILNSSEEKKISKQHTEKLIEHKAKIYKVID